MPNLISINNQTMSSGGGKNVPDEAVKTITFDTANYILNITKGDGSLTQLDLSSLSSDVKLTNGQLDGQILKLTTSDGLVKTIDLSKFTTSDELQNALKTLSNNIEANANNIEANANNIEANMDMLDNGNFINPNAYFQVLDKISNKILPKGGRYEGGYYKFDVSPISAFHGQRSLQISQGYTKYETPSFRIPDNCKVRISYPYKLIPDPDTNINKVLIYIGTNSYDHMGDMIEYRHITYKGKTMVELSQDLNDGDTVIHFNGDMSKWTNTGGSGYNKGILFWEKQSNGLYCYQHPDGTQERQYGMSRKSWTSLYDAGAVDTDAKTITLRQPWDKGHISAGAKAVNSFDGGTYNYYQSVSLSAYDEFKIKRTNYHNTKITIKNPNSVDGVVSMQDAFREGAVTATIVGLLSYRFYHNSSAVSDIKTTKVLYPFIGMSIK